MIGREKNKAGADNEYREERIKPAVLTMLIVVVIVTVPLGWLNKKIGDEGLRIADTTKYNEVIKVVDQDVKTVQKMLNNELVDEQQLMGVSTAPMVTLITPDIMPTNMSEALNSKKSQIVLKGIYWSPTDPIVTIGEENYHIGEMVQGHRIIEIRKTEVVFEDPMGEEFVKYFYDYIDVSGKNKKTE